MKRTMVVILVVVLYGAAIGGFWVTSVRSLFIFPAADSYSWQSFPDANNGGSDNFEITSSIAPPKNMRGWITFNLSKIPPGAWIITAKLWLRIWHKTTDDDSHGTADSTGRIYGVYRVIQPWTEYNITWTNQPEYTREHHAEAAVPPGQGGWEGPILWMEWDVTGIVTDWMWGASNYGILVRDSQEDAQILSSTQFFTHDKVPDEGYYPRLAVTYVTPLAAALLVALLIIEGLFITVIWRRQAVRLDASRRA